MRRIITFSSLLLIFNAGSISGQRVTVCRDRYVSTYDVQLLCPAQVEWQVCPDDIGSARRSPSWRFIEDIAHPLAVACHDDFTASGYHRGHLMPAADRSSSNDAMRSTFTLSNCAPQLPSLNMGLWKATEHAIRNAVLLGDTVTVVTIPIFLARDTMRLGSHRIAVPHAYFKAAWCSGNDSIIGYWFFFNHK